MKRIESIPAKTFRSSHLSRLAAAFRRCARGSVAIEIALLAPVLAALLLGSVDFGTFVFQKMQVQSASRAGAQFAIQSAGNADDTGGISNAALTSSSNLEAGTSVKSVSFCACADGSETAVSATTGCGGTCSGGDFPALTVRVTVSNTFTPIFPYPGIPDSILLEGETSLRVP